MTGFIEGLTTGQLFMAIFTVMTLLFMGSMLAIEMAWDRREHREVRRNLERMVAEQDNAAARLEASRGVSTDVSVEKKAS